MVKKTHGYICLVLVMLCAFWGQAFAQVQQASDSITLSVPSDTVVTDSIQPQPNKKKRLNAPITYQSADSVAFDLNSKRAMLYGNAVIVYEDLTLKANYIEIDFDHNEMFARGSIDTTGKVIGKPEITEGESTFATDSVKYNLDTKRGLIYKVIMQEGEGYIHGKTIKKMEDNTTFIKDGKYTTCDAEHPHYEIRFTKAKIIPNDKIVTGPAYLCFADVPTPLALPFGLFPNSKSGKNGIIIPSWGESTNRGFYLENGGFYWGINDYVNLAILGDIYTRGSWGLEGRSSYKKRYKYTGFVDLSYSQNYLGIKNTSSYEESTDFSFQWTHQQDPKSHPTRRFSANVNILSSQFNKYNLRSATDYLSNTFQSSISYSNSWKGKYFLTANLTHSQNTLNKTVSMSLPNISFSTDRFYPFRRKERVGSLKWFENINISYQANALNQINTFDSLLFKSETWKYRMQYGLKHTVPISATVPVLKVLNWTNSLNLNSRWYTQTYNQHWQADSTSGKVCIDTVNGFKAATDFAYTSSLTTKLYGMYQFPKGYLRAVRHVVTPTVSFSYAPDFSKSWWGYNKSYTNQSGQEVMYSIFTGTVFGGVSSSRMAQLNFGIGNNLEIKVRSKKDSISGMKKIVLIENLTVSSAYNMAVDSLQWSPLSVSGRTTLMKCLYITYAGVWDFYTYDSLGVRKAKTEWSQSGNLLHWRSSAWNFSLTYALNNNTFTRQQEDKEVKNSRALQWDANISYNLYYSLRDDFVKRFNSETVQTVSLTTSINFTPNWKFSITTGYDFDNKEVSYTSIDLYRDLHCWEMRLNWIPMGFQKGWNFIINVKASVLQDLKYRMKQRENY